MSITCVRIPLRFNAWRRHKPVTGVKWQGNTSKVVMSLCRACHSNSPLTRVATQVLFLEPAHFPKPHKDVWELVMEDSLEKWSDSIAQRVPSTPGTT